jgi:hypothetical protein
LGPLKPNLGLVPPLSGSPFTAALPMSRERRDVEKKNDIVIGEKCMRQR